MKGIIYFIFSLLFLFSTQTKAAKCDVVTANGDLIFNNVSSINIRTTTYNTSNPNVGLNCTGGLLGLLASDKINLRVTSVNGLLLKNDKGDTLPYKLFADPNAQYAILLNTTYSYNNVTLLQLLGLGGNSVKFPLYLRTVPGAYNVSAGEYTDTITLNWDWDVCEIALVTCLGLRSKGNKPWTGTVKLKILNDCMINIPDVNFGSAPLASAFPSITQSISLACTKGSNYLVALDYGKNAVGTQRRMKNGSSYLNYNIYQGGSGTVPWGLNDERRSSATADVNPGPGTGSNNNTQGFIFRTVVSPVQNTPPAGNYTDSVIIYLDF